MQIKPKKWARQVSNLRPSGYEPPALTTELRAPSEGDYNMAKIIPWAGFSKHLTFSSYFVFHPYLFKRAVYKPAPEFNF
jgi:hypothetical protein